MKHTSTLIAALTVLLTVPPLIFKSDPFGVGGGYTPFWLAYLYVLGAYLRKAELLKELRGLKALAGFAAAAAITAGGKLAESLVPPPHSILWKCPV